MKRLVFLGPDGSYSHFAALNFVNDFDEIVPLPDFSRVIHSVGENTAAIVPIENSLEGAVNAVTDILAWEVNCFIIEEFILSIKHKLFALNGIQKNGIKRIVTHPQAYGQCRAYLAEFFPDVKIELADSTSKALEYLDGNTAAIAGAHIKRAGLNILDELPIGNNDTRFVLLGNKRSESPQNNKVSVIFESENKPGGLLKTLNIIADYKLNMTKIISRPHKSTLGRYIFAVDFMGNIADLSVKNALADIESSCSYFKFLGNYYSKQN